MKDQVKTKFHGFTLSPRASDLINSVQSGRKSKRVSDAIEWFFDSPVYGKERDDEGEWTGKFVRSSHGAPVPVGLLENIEKMQERLLKNQLDDASSRGVTHHRDRKKWFRYLSRKTRRRE